MHNLANWLGRIRGYENPLQNGRIARKMKIVGTRIWIEWDIWGGNIQKTVQIKSKKEKFHKISLQLKEVNTAFGLSST